MAYIKKENVAAIRAALKAEFPTWKFSIRLDDNHSGVRIAIMESPLDFVGGYVGRGEESYVGSLQKGYASINEKFIDGNWSGDVLVALQKINDIAHSQGWYNNSDLMTDYFDVAYYVWLSLGKYYKHYKIIEPKTTAKAPKFSGSALDCDAIFAGGTLSEYIHSKTGETLQLMKLEVSLSRDEFMEFRDWMKSEGRGYYSRFAHGFILTTDKNQEVA